MIEDLSLLQEAVRLHQTIIDRLIDRLDALERRLPPPADPAA